MHDQCLRHLALATDVMHGMHMDVFVADIIDPYKDLYSHADCYIYIFKISAGLG